MTYVLWATLAFAVSLLASWAGARVALAPLLQQAPSTWVDRARLAFPARAASRFALIFLPTLAAVSVSFLDPGQGAGTWLASMSAAVPAFVAATVVRLHVERVIRRRQVGLGELLRGWLGYWLVVFPHLVVALICVALVGDEPTGRAWLVVAAAALATAAACAGCGVMLARLLGLARPASDRLARAVAVASESTGVRPRAVYEIDLRMANAFALPAMRLLLFTGDAVRALDDAQIAAISRHELGHVSEPLRVVAARVLNAVLLIGALVAARRSLAWRGSASRSWSSSSPSSLRCSWDARSPVAWKSAPTPSPTVTRRTTASTRAPSRPSTRRTWCLP
jgi:Zn-dependent protease with chaperone function